MIQFWKKYVVRAKRRDGDTVEFTLDHQPDAVELRELLDADNLCEEFEYIYVFKNKKRIYTYPCRRKRNAEEKKEDEFTKLAKELLLERLKKTLTEEKKEYTIHDLLAQFYNDIDLAEKIAQKIQNKLNPASSIDFDKFMEFITKVMSMLPQFKPVQAPTQLSLQQVQAPSQEDLKKVEDILTKVKANINPEAVSEGYQKLLSEVKPPCEELTGEKCIELQGEGEKNA